MITAVVATSVAYFILQLARISKRQEVGTIGRIAGLGYAIPGTVLAVGLLVPLAGFDNWLDDLMRRYFNISTGLLFSGSVAIVVYACTLRFLAVAYGTIEAGFLRVSPNIDMAPERAQNAVWSKAWRSLSGPSVP